MINSEIELLNKLTEIKSIMKKSLKGSILYHEETIKNLDEMIDGIAVTCDHIYSDSKKSAIVLHANQLTCEICGEDF